MATLMEDKVRDYESYQDQRSAELAEKESLFKAESPDSLLGAWELANDYLDLVSYPLASCNLYKAHNLPVPDSWFTLIRSFIAKMLSYGEIALTSYLDVTFSELAEKLAPLDSVTLAQRLLFVKKLAFLIDQVDIFSHMHSKMRFVWTDLIVRLSVLMKNIINYPGVYPAMALNHPDHEAYSTLLALVKSALLISTESLRKRYELKDQTGDDLDKALVYLSVLKQIAGITGSNQEMDTLQKRYDVWHAKLTADRLKAKEG